MSINFKCPKCRKQFKLADKLAGRRGKCPDCGSQFKIPAGRAPVTQEMPRMPDNPFGSLEDYDGSGEGEGHQPRRRGQRGLFSQLVGCLFLLLLLLVALAGGAYSAVYFKLIKREVAEPYLARIPFKVPGLTTGKQSGETTAAEGTAKGPADTAAKGGATETKKEEAVAAVPFEFRFLPDKAAMLVSINVEGLMTSKLYQKLKPKLLAGLLENDKALDDAMKASAGVPLTGLSRIILGAHTKDDSVMVLRTKQPIAAAEIKKNRKGEFTEVKAGKYVMYDAKKDPFCVADDRTLLIGGTSEALKKVLERDKPPEMVPDLVTVFKQVTETKTISLALGPQDLRREFPAIDAAKLPKELLDSQAFALQIELTAGVEMSASLQCKNAADAEALKKMAGELARGYFEQLAKANAGNSLEQWAKDAIQALGQLKLGISADTVNGTLSVTDDVGANLVLLGVSLMAPAPAKK